MTRTRFLVALGMMAAPAVAFGGGPPNVLWLVTDDHRPDTLRCFNLATTGRPDSPLGFVSSPQADRLAEQGVLFTNTYCQAPGCAPSRFSMMTGRYPHRCGVFGFEYAHDGSPHLAPMVPDLMKRAGYTTAAIGKVDVRVRRWQGESARGEVRSHDISVHFMKDLAANGATAIATRGDTANEETFYFPGGAKRTITTSDRATPEQKRDREALEKELDLLRHYSKPARNLIIGGKSPLPPEMSLDGNILKTFTEYLAQPGKPFRAPGGKEVTGPDPAKPVFVNLGFHGPHTPVFPSKQFRDRFEGQAYRVPDFDRAELDRLPPQLRTLFEQQNFADLKPKDQEQAIRDYFAFTAQVDDFVGKVIDAFVAFSQAAGRDYLIVYTVGDHGWHLGEQGLGAKFGPYATSTRNAAIVLSSDPARFSPGTVCDRFVEFVDFAPTILKAAGLPRPGMDGVPLDETLSGTAPPRDYVLGELNHVYGPRAWLRTREFAFSMRVREQDGKPGEGYAPGEKVGWALTAPRAAVEMALFDLRADPAERWNVADDPRHVKLADFLRAKVGRTVLGDGRLEIDWAKKDAHAVSDFAKGEHTGRLVVPPDLIPAPRRQGANDNHHKEP